MIGAVVRRCTSRWCSYALYVLRQIAIVEPSPPGWISLRLLTWSAAVLSGTAAVITWLHASGLRTALDRTARCRCSVKRVDVFALASSRAFLVARVRAECSATASTGDRRRSCSRSPRSLSIVVAALDSRAGLAASDGVATCRRRSSSAPVCDRSPRRSALPRRRIAGCDLARGRGRSAAEFRPHARRGRLDAPGDHAANAARTGVGVGR